MEKEQPRQDGSSDQRGDVEKNPEMIAMESLLDKVLKVSKVDLGARIEHSRSTKSKLNGKQISVSAELS
jgi:hypothetical protein